MRSIHSIETNANSDFSLTVRIPKTNAKHSQHCNATASEATAKRKEKARLKRIQISKLKREQKLALRQAKKAGPKNPAKNVVIPATTVVETQCINITVTNNVNVQVTKTISQKTTQEANLDRVVESLNVAPYIDGQQVEYTYEESQVPENPSRNNTQKDPKTDPIIISDDEDILQE